MTETAGQKFTATARRYFHIGTRTRQTAAKRTDLMEAIANACYYPGYYTEATQAAFAGAGNALRSWDKHVEGYRIAGDLKYRMECMSMWHFTALLGQLIDDCENVGQAEVWFQNLARELRPQMAA